ncbi:Cytochrome P450 9e2, partial [Gryllus bimaculatus]
MPYARPLPLFGNVGALMVGRTNFFDLTVDSYRKFEGHPVFGFFQFMKPVIYIRDPQLIKLVAVKDFDHFVDHQAIGSEKLEPMFARNLFSLKGQEWRDMRATLSPAFTSSKMRNIFKLIDLCGVQMADFLKRKFEKSKDRVYEAEMKDFFTRFANDVIATSAFGIEVDSLGQPENEFYHMGRDLTNTKGIKALIFLGYMFLPKVMEVLRIPFNSTKVRNFFHNLVHDTIKERQQKGIFRPDMLQLLMQAREGQLKAEAGDEQENISGAKLKKLTDFDMTAQAVIFFFAGFDTVSTAMSYCAYALARHPEVQQRLQREVDEAFEKNDGQLTYEAVQEAKYMDMFISGV